MINVQVGVVTDIIAASDSESVDASMSLSKLQYPSHMLLRFSLWDYLKTILLIILATAVGWLLHNIMSAVNLAMLYLLAVVISAVRYGYGAAMMCAALSVFVFNFFFIPPQLTFRVADAQYLLTFSALFVVGIVIADLTARVSFQAATAQRRAQDMTELYSLSRALSVSSGQAEIVATILKHVQQSFHAQAYLYLVGEQGELVAYPHAMPDEAQQQDVLKWTMQAGSSAGAGTEHFTEKAAYYIALKTAHETLGILVMILAPHAVYDVEFRQLAQAFASQSALALEAARLAAKARQAELLQERDKLQAALLSSISHDLRTPLVSIAGALGSLRDSNLHYNDSTRGDLIEGAWQEAERLNRLVGNLLEMTRLQAGTIRLKRDWYDLRELIGVARSQLAERLKGRDLQIQLPEDLPLLYVDFTLMTQVIVNLLDNALKYSPTDKCIDIRAYFDTQTVTIEVTDRGIGIPEQDIGQIFEKFYRAQNASIASGTGLGLSICQGIVEAHQGTICAGNRPKGGAIFRLMLPLGATNA